MKNKIIDSYFYSDEGGDILGNRTYLLLYILLCMIIN